MDCRHPQDKCSWIDLHNAQDEISVLMCRVCQTAVRVICGHAFSAWEPYAEGVPLPIYRCQACGANVTHIAVEDGKRKRQRP